MKVFVTLVVFGAIIFENAYGIKIQPAVLPDRSVGPIPVACTAVYLMCPTGQQLGVGANGCPACVACPLVLLKTCWDGSIPKQNPPVQNKCPTYSACPPQPIKEVPIAIERAVE